jgi:hypothetical protein
MEGAQDQDRLEFLTIHLGDQIEEFEAGNLRRQMAAWLKLNSQHYSIDEHKKLLTTLAELHLSLDTGLDYWPHCLSYLPTDLFGVPLKVFTQAVQGPPERQARSSKGRTNSGGTEQGSIQRDAGNTIRTCPRGGHNSY